MKKPEKPLTTPDGEAHELGDDFFAKARAGRPAMLAGERKKRVNVMMDPDVHSALKDRGINMSDRINRLLRDDLGL